MRRSGIALILGALLALAAVPAAAQVAVKVRDISFFDGLKENQVYGYGLVVGLQGTGDTKLSPLTKTSLKNLLKTLGMEGDEIISKNAAAVLLTAQLPAFSRVGDRVDVTVSSIGDSKSLEGGILIQSPLRGADGQIYVAAQGSVSSSKSKGGRKEIRTAALIAGGGVIEREVAPEIVMQENIGNPPQLVRSVYLVLKNWDFLVAHNIIKAVAAKYPDSKPEMAPGGKIKILLVKDVSLPEFISSIESMEIPASMRAVVVVNERDGTIVAGGDVKLSEAMVSKEGVTVEVQGQSKKNSVSLLKETASVKDLVDALNATGAGTADIISILKALKTAGALHADLVVR